jgi:D-amino peptidase
MMKVLVMTDFEGATGVMASDEQIDPTGRAHEEARRMFTGDVNAAIEGALDAGADEVVVLEGHGTPFSLIFRELNKEVNLIRGRRQWELHGIDESFDAMFVIGAHAGAGSARGILSHSFTSRKVHALWINDGPPATELDLWAIEAGQFGVPVVLVTGDAEIVAHARELLGNVETVAVKEPITRECALCLPPAKTGPMIRAAARAAVERLPEAAPYRISTPFELRVDYVSALLAARVARQPGVRWIEGSVLAYTAEDIREALAVMVYAG